MTTRRNFSEVGTRGFRLSRVPRNVWVGIHIDNRGPIRYNKHIVNGELVKMRRR